MQTSVPVNALPLLTPWLLFLIFYAGVWLIVRFFLPELASSAAHLARALLRRLVRLRPIESWVSTRRHRLEPLQDYLPVLIVLGFGLLAAVWSGDTFLDLAEELRADNPSLLGFDRAIHQWVVSLRGTGATEFFVFFTMLGSPITLGIISGAVCLVLLVTKRWRWAAYLTVTVGIGGLLNLQLKTYFARSRPSLSEALRQASGYSFPSGHAMGTTVVVIALAYLAIRLFPGWSRRAIIIALAVCIILAVSLSRVYLGVHWSSDIAAGAAAGTIWATATTVGYEAVRRIRRVRALRRRVEISATDDPS